MTNYDYASCIYIISNNIDNKVYIGYAVNFYNRKRRHLWELRKNIHSNEHLQRAWNKYGESAFTIEILEEWDKEFLLSMEHHWCNLLQAHNPKYGYNIQPTSPKGKVGHSEQTKRKISESNKGKTRVHTEETKKKISEAGKGRPSPNKGKKLLQETKDKISKTQLGRKQTPEHIENMAKTKRGKKQTQQHIDNRIASRKRNKQQNY